MSDHDRAFDSSESLKLLAIIGRAPMERLVDQMQRDLALFLARIDAAASVSEPEWRRFFHKVLGFASQFFLPGCAGVARQALASGLESPDRIKYFLSALREEILRAEPQVGLFRRDLARNMCGARSSGAVERREP